MDPSQTVQYTALISGITKQVGKQQTKYICLSDIYVRLAPWSETLIRGTN